MNPRERYLAVYDDENRTKLDQVPTFVQYIKEGFVDQHFNHMKADYNGQLTKKKRLDAARILGFDSVYMGFPGSYAFRPQKLPDEDGKLLLTTSSGRIGSKNSSFYNKGMFYCMENLDKIQETRKKVPVKWVIRRIIKHYEKVSPLIFPVLQIGGVFDKVWMSMGMKHFSRNYRKKTPLYRAVVRFFGQRMIDNVQGLIDATGGRGKVVTLLDDVAFKGRPMIPPDRWESDMGPWYTKVCSMISDAGMIPQLHTDGDVTELIPSFQKVGLRGVQGFEGGMDPVSFNEKFPDFVVIGGGDVSEIIPFGTKEQIYTHVKDLMDAFKENRHFIIGPSTVIVKEMPYENVQHLMAAIQKYGKYP